MAEVLTFRNLLLLVLIIGMSACGSTKSKEKSESNNTKANDSELDQGSIKMIDNKGVNFEYELGEKTEFGENFMIDIECVVTNVTSEEIDYLNQSCNGLDYYLIIRPGSYKVMPLINCNATWGMINKLASKDSIKFKTQIFQFKNSDPIEKIGLDFRVVDKFIPFDTLREKPELIEIIFRSEIQIDNVILGDKK